MSQSQLSLLFDTEFCGVAPFKTALQLPSYLRDHRKRLRERFLAGGPEAMPDYELLELVLFRAIPRQDVKPLARLMLETLGSFDAVISASKERLLDIPGVAEAIITELKLVEAAAVRLAQGRVQNRQVIGSWQALLDYCQTTLAHKEVEHFRVFFLDRQNQLIADEAQGSGTVDHVPVYPREVTRRALQLNATALILVHNHPSGDPTPSASDIAMTEAIVQAAATMGIVVHDHVIIGKSGPFSFREQGLLSS